MQKGFYRFYKKEAWINRNIEIEDSLYTELKKIADNELDTSINKLIDACVEHFKIENDTVIYYKKPQNEITISRSIRLRESMWNKLDALKKDYDISLYKLINMSIKYTLEDK
ncbi:MAG: hypothetical protein IJ053_06360 [Lachnospiraceae bacterium]|nr:hypothetical protein [Lachnospiraceae bacterium]